jgi:hypothetical protein
MSHRAPGGPLLDSRVSDRIRSEINHVRIACGTLLLALACTAAFGADVYRTTAPDGTVSYSDRPQGSDSQFVFSANPGATRTAQAQTPGAAAANDAAVAPEAPSAPTQQEGPTSAQLRAERQKNCEIARETQQRFELSRRLFRTNAAGQREYLDDTAVAEARAKAAQDVEDWCG